MNGLDEQKFLQLYDQYVDKIYRYIFFRIGSEELAKDLTSEVFLRFWQYLNKNPELKNKKLQNPRAFIYQVTRNLIVDVYRQKDKLPISLEEVTDIKIADKNTSQDERAIRSSEIDMVKGALSNLNEVHQEIIIWRYLDEMEVREIAEILEKSENAVRIMISRALTELKAALSQFRT